MRYEIAIYWSDDDGAYIAEVADLPGCMADGRTYQEALAAAEIAIEEWIETPTNSVARFRHLALIAPQLRSPASPFTCR